MTLNIWNLAGNWEQRRREVVAWLDLVAPDIVCLEEVMEGPSTENQAVWLSSAGAHSFDVAYGRALELGDAWFGVAVLSRRPIETSETVRLPALDQPDENRVILHARTGGVDVFCTHFNWLYHHGVVREAQALAVVDAVSRLADPNSPLPPIVAGDLNAEPDSTEVRFLCGLTSLAGRSTYFQDAWRVAGGRGPGFTWDNRNPFAAAEREPDRRIDYVLVGWRRHGGPGRIASARVVCDRALTGIFASDHFGVVADIET